MMSSAYYAGNVGSISHGTTGKGSYGNCFRDTSGTNGQVSSSEGQCIQAKYENKRGEIRAGNVPEQVLDNDEQTFFDEGEYTEVEEKKYTGKVRDRLRELARDGEDRKWDEIKENLKNFLSKEKNTDTNNNNGSQNMEKDSMENANGVNDEAKEGMNFEKYWDIIDNTTSKADDVSQDERERINNLFKEVEKNPQGKIIVKKVREIAKEKGEKLKLWLTTPGVGDESSHAGSMAIKGNFSTEKQYLVLLNIKDDDGNGQLELGLMNLPPWTTLAHEMLHWIYEIWQKANPDQKDLRGKSIRNHKISNTHKNHIWDTLEEAETMFAGRAEPEYPKELKDLTEMTLLESEVYPPRWGHFGEDKEALAHFLKQDGEGFDQKKILDSYDFEVGGKEYGVNKKEAAIKQIKKYQELKKNRAYPQPKIINWKDVVKYQDEKQKQQDELREQGEKTIRIEAQKKRRLQRVGQDNAANYTSQLSTFIDKLDQSGEGENQQTIHAIDEFAKIHVAVHSDRKEIRKLNSEGVKFVKKNLSGFRDRLVEILSDKIETRLDRAIKNATKNLREREKAEDKKKGKKKRKKK